MAPSSKALTASRLLTVAALLACSQYGLAVQLGGRRTLQTWVAESGSFSVETGVSKPSTFKSKTEVTWDHNAKPPAPEPAADPPAPSKSAPAPAPAEEKTVKGKQVDFTFSKTSEHTVEVNKDAMGTKPVLVKDNPQIQVSVDVNKATAAAPAADAPADAPAPSPQKETTYVIQSDSHCGCSNCACSGH